MPSSRSLAALLLVGLAHALPSILHASLERRAKFLPAVDNYRFAGW